MFGPSGSVDPSMPSAAPTAADIAMSGHGGGLQTNIRRQRSTKRKRSIDVFEDDEDPIDDASTIDGVDSDLALNGVPPSDAPSTGLLSDPLSIPNQISFFQRTLGSHRFDSADGILSGRPLVDRPAKGSVQHVSESRFYEEASSHIPSTLIQSLLEEDAHIARQEAKENLYQTRLVTFVGGVDGSTWSILPSGALLDEVTLARVTWTTNTTTTKHNGEEEIVATPTPTIDLLHSLAIDSTIRQILCSTPDTADDGTKTMPLIFSRTCYSIYVHTVVCRLPSAPSSSSSSSSSPSLFLLDSHTFPSPIVTVAPNPVVPHEVCLLLQDGTIVLWSYSDWSLEMVREIQVGRTNHASSATAKRRMTQLPIATYLPPMATIRTPIPWARILFVPHARSLLIVLRKTLVQVDLRAPYTTSTNGMSRGRSIRLPPAALAPSSTFTFASHALIEPAPFGACVYAAVRCANNPFQFLLATADQLLLCDIRQIDGRTNAVRTLLEWSHHQQGEPPAEIIFIDTTSGGGGDAACADCNELDNFFITFNKNRNEVTLYHYKFDRIDTPSSQGTASLPTTQLTTAYSSFAPLRISSFVHAIRAERDANHAAAASPSSSSESPVSPLVGVSLLPSPLVCAPSSPLVASRLFHLFQLGSNGSIITQMFQHRHDDRSLTTTTNIQMPQFTERRTGKKEDADMVVPARVAVKTEANRAAPATPTALRVKVDSQHQSGVVTPHRSTGIASGVSPSPSLSPHSLASSPTASSPHGELPPWMLPNELKPFHAVNLSKLLKACTDNIVSAPTKGKKGGGSITDGAGRPSPSSSQRPSFSHLLARVIDCFNRGAAILFTYLALPKTLLELTQFIIDHPDVFDKETWADIAAWGIDTKRASNNDSEADTGDLASVSSATSAGGSARKRRTRSSTRPAADAASSSVAPLSRSQSMSARAIHLIAHIVYTGIHPFLHSLQQGQAHPPYHMERWTREMRRFKKGTTGEGGKKPFTLSPESQSDDSDDDDDDADELDPYSDSFPQPTFSLYHYHMSLARFASAAAAGRPNPADGAASSTGSAAPIIESCTCAGSSVHANSSKRSAARNGDDDERCCCMALCASAHCLLLNSISYCSSPSVLNIAWPSADHLRDLEFAPLPPPPTGDEEDVHVELQQFDPNGNHRAPMRVSMPPTTAGAPVMDLSQDISFLMSQSSDGPASQDIFTQPIAEEDEAAGERLIDSPARASLAHSAPPDAPTGDGDSDSGDAPPSDPHALSDMIAAMAKNWQSAERLTERMVAASRTQRSSSHDRIDAADDADDIGVLEEELSTSNGLSFTHYLIAHQLALDPSQHELGGSEFGEDLRGSMLEEMEDRAGRDED